MLKSLMSGLVLTAMFASSSAFAAEKPAQKQVVKSSTDRITPNELSTMLRNFGYEARNIGTDKLPVFRINESRHGLKIPMNVSISTNATTMWFQVSLLNLPEKPESKFLLKLLTSNLGKTHFVISGKVLRIRRPIDNIGITPKSIRLEISAFLGDINVTKKDWMKKKAPATSLVKK